MTQSAAPQALGSGPRPTGGGASAPRSSAERHRSRRDPRPRAKLTWRRAIARDWRLYSFLIVPIVFLLVFKYVPMLGNIIAFRRFRPGGVDLRR